MNDIALDWLSKGDDYQRCCLNVILDSKLLNTLAPYNPRVVGTIPLGIYTEHSDIDIILNSNDLIGFQSIARNEMLRLGVKTQEENLTEDRFVVSFEYKQFIFELYCTNKDSPKQHGYRHMLIEKRILELSDAIFKENIIKLKLQGFKTEPAFGYLLQLEDPYSNLLTFEKMNDHELIAFIQSNLIKHGM